MHKEVFVKRSHSVDTGLSGDLPELLLSCSERGPRRPVNRAPIIDEVVPVFTVKRFHDIGSIRIDFIVGNLLLYFLQ